MECADCSRSFAKVRALRMHRQRAHGDVPVPIAVGQAFGRWVVISVSLEKKKYCAVRCACGVERVVLAGDLRSGMSQSCGCLHKEAASLANRQHGMNDSPEYRAWCAMKDRVTATKGEKFEQYQQRGIFVCDEWQNDFTAFYLHIGPKPSPTHSVDRIDNDRGYEPGNVRWATAIQQANNRRPRRWKKRP